MTQELDAIKEDLATIKAVLSGVPGTASQGLVGDLYSLRSDIAQRFERVYESMSEAGKSYLSNQSAASTYVTKQQCAECPKHNGLSLDWRFWLAILLIVMLLLGSNADKVASLLRVFGL